MSEWRTTTLGNIALIDIGGTPSRGMPQYWASSNEEGEYWVSIADLKSRFINDTKERITEQGILNSNAKRVACGTLIMSFKLSIGRVAIVGTELYTNEAIAAISPKDNHITTSYLYYILPSAAKNTITDNAIKGATLNKSSLSNLVLTFPSNQLIQKRITTILESIDKTIEKTEALIEKYQHIKAGLMHDLFTRGITTDGKLRPPREEAPELYQETVVGWIPKDWKVCTIDKLCSHIVDCPHSTPIYRSSGIPCIRTADMMPGQLLLEQAYKVSYEDYLYRIQRLKPQKGDIIYSREGERLGIASPVGAEAVCLGQRVMLLRPHSTVDSAFFLWSMNYPIFYRKVIKGLGATTSPHVNVGDIKAILTFRPPIIEQRAIGSCMENIQNKLLKEEQYRMKLYQKKSGLMQDLLSGKVEVKPDAE